MFKLFSKKCLLHVTWELLRNSSSTIPHSTFTLKFHRHVYQRLSCLRYSKTAHDLTPDSEEDGSQSFQEMLAFRRNQALASILIELPSKDDIQRATSFCKDFGNVKTFLPYSGEFGSDYLLTEFANATVAKKFLKTCQFKSTSDAYPVHSRLLRYEGHKQWKVSNSCTESQNSVDVEEQNMPRDSCQLSKLIEKECEKSKLSDLSIRKRFLFGCLIHEALEGMFPNAAVLPFGSSVNGFGTEGCDLDVVLRLYPDKVSGSSEIFFQTRTFVGDSRDLQKKAISGVYEILKTFFPGINYIQKVLQARVPILKFKHKILDLDCDVSVNNVSAVTMSEILYFYSELDPRVRPLVYAVRRWAKEANITYETPGSWITNFSLTLLVIFFLQNRPVPILPPLKKAISLIGLTPSVYYIEKPTVWRKAAQENNETLAMLLLEFMVFLGEFPFLKKFLCIWSGQASLRDDGYPLWIRYPVEEDKNVSKNVSPMELKRLCDLASDTAKHLATHISEFQNSNVDFSLALGMHLLKSRHSQKLDISELYSDNTKMS